VRFERDADPETVHRLITLLEGGGPLAIVCSLIATARLNDRERYAYLKDVLERMTNGRLDDLLPWNWKPNAG
jgi:transposase